MDHDLTHAKELDAAVGAAGGPDDLGICETALKARGDLHVDQQIATFEDPEERAVIRKALLDAGRPFDEAAIDRFLTRCLIGGSLTFGIAIGLALADQRRKAER